MSETPLRIGITGAGMMGRAHARSIATYGARVVAVHDVRLEAAQQLADEMGADTATDDLAAFFDRKLDGVVIATPPPIRIEPIRRACERGIHLMIEKPPALTMEDGLACLQPIKATGVITAVGFQLRYSPACEHLREMLAGQTVHLVRSLLTIDYYLSFPMSPWFLQSAISGGPIAEQAIHPLDAVRFVLGDPAPVQAHALAVKNMALERTEFDAENAVQVTYELDNGWLGTHLNHCGSQRGGLEIEVIGPHLWLKTEGWGNGTITGYLNGQEVNEPAPSGNRLGLDKTQAWLRAIETGDRSLVRSSFADSLKTLALVDAAVRSRGTGRFAQALKTGD